MEHVLPTEAMRTINAANSNPSGMTFSETKGYILKNADGNTEPTNPKKRVWIVVDEDWW